LDGRPVTNWSWPANWSSLTNVFNFPASKQLLNWFRFLKCILYSQIKKNWFCLDLSYFHIQMLSPDLNYGRLARPRQMKAMDEIQKENDMKLARNAQLMF
jgi:hypothetical protein